MGTDTDGKDIHSNRNAIFEDVSRINRRHQTIDYGDYGAKETGESNWPMERKGAVISSAVISSFAFFFVAFFVVAKNDPLLF